MNFCPNCGSKLEEGQHYCRECGYFLLGREQPPQRSVPFFREFGEIFLVKGAPYIGLILILQFLLLAVISSLPFFPGEQATYTQFQHGETSSLSALSPLGILAGIFTNNLFIGLREMMPGFGIFWFGAAIYSTARVVEIIGLTQQIPGAVVTLNLVLLPHSWVELSAYAVALYEGMYITTSFAKRRDGKILTLTGFFWKEVGMSVVVLCLILAVAATFETGEIEMGPLILLSWVPFIGVALLVVSARRMVLEKED